MFQSPYLAFTFLLVATVSPLTSGSPLPQPAMRALSHFLSPPSSPELKPSLAELLTMKHDQIARIEGNHWAELVKQYPGPVTHHLDKELYRLNHQRLIFVKEKDDDYVVPMKTSENKDHPFYKVEEAMQALNRHVDIATKVLRENPHLNVPWTSSAGERLTPSASLVYASSQASSKIEQIDDLAWDVDHHIASTSGSAARNSHRRISSPHSHDLTTPLLRQD